VIVLAQRGEPQANDMVRGQCRLLAVLIQANHVSTRIAEPGGDLRMIDAYGLHDLAAVFVD
jgi:hypothetical protein